MDKIGRCLKNGIYYFLIMPVMALSSLLVLLIWALCVPAVCLLAGLHLSAQSGDGRIEIPADQITCICPPGANKLYELKSFKKSSLSGIPSGMLNQFKAYLNNNNVTDMS